MGDTAECASSTPSAELAEFLSPSTRIDIRRSAIAYVVGVSVTPDGSQLFKGEDFIVGKALCLLFENLPEERSAIFSALTNIASEDSVSSNFIIENTKVVPLSATHCRNRDPQATFAAKLLSNLSIHFPAKVFEKIQTVWENVVADTVDLLNESSSGDFVDYMGYMLVNCTVMPRVRRKICENYLTSILPLISQNNHPKRRLIAVDIIRNLCFDDENHKLLLDVSDEFLSSLLKPLADVNDELSDDEIQKLPLQLQYYDGVRCNDKIIIQKLIEALYQLCATTHGRNILRQKGVYAILRELDKNYISNLKDKENSSSKLKFGFIGDFSDTSVLHALIGVLIRYETEMEIDPNLSTIRHLK